MQIYLHRKGLTFGAIETGQIGAMLLSCWRACTARFRSGDVDASIKECLAQTRSSLLLLFIIIPGVAGHAGFLDPIMDYLLARARRYAELRL